MRPTLRLLQDELIERIIAEAREVLRTLGVEIHNRAVLSLLADTGPI
jgi:trimethylamine:corrinoid methyltransferase-like protein